MKIHFFRASMEELYHGYVLHLMSIPFFQFLGKNCRACTQFCFTTNFCQYLLGTPVV